MLTMDPLSETLIQEIRAAWGDSSLAPVPPERMPAEGISRSSRILLTEVGLPTRYSDLITFPRDEQLLQPITLAGVQYHTLAEEAGGPVALKASTDEVWALDPTGRGRQRFVNTHPGFLVLFLGILLPLIDRLHNQDFPEYLERIDEAAARFAAHDPAALADPDSWWPTVLEVAREGYV